jgi:hypothetical protein
MAFLVQPARVKTMGHSAEPAVASGLHFVPVRRPVQ